MATVHTGVTPRLNVRSMFNLSLLQLIFVVTALSQRCTRTRAVPVQEQPVKKVHVLRRIPATCSNWDKAWTWLTKKECGTKYRLDYVTVPSRETTEYRLEYVCCDGDTACKEAENINSDGFDTSDEKFLALVLGSTAACIVLVIIIFAITFYTKKTRCPHLCDPKNHTYSSADGEEQADGNDIEKFNHDDGDSDTDHKAGDSDYAEIGDPTLPRYTDIFKEPGMGDDGCEDEGEDPFHRATAPPMYSEVPPNRVYANTSGGNARAPPMLHSSVTDKIQIEKKGATSYSVEREVAKMDDETEGQKAGHRGGAGADGEPKYCNVRDKKQKRKKKTSTTTIGNDQSSCDKTTDKKDTNTSKSNSKRTTQSITPKTVDKIVKSSSASENIDSKTPDSSLKRQKRRSHPPIESVGSSHHHISTATPQSATLTQATNVASASLCSVIQEAPPPLPPRKPIGGGEKRRGKAKQRPTSSELSVHQTKASSKRNNNNACEYENRAELKDNEIVEESSLSSSPRPSSKVPSSIAPLGNIPSEVDKSSNNVPEEMDQSRPLSPSAGSVLSGSRSPSLGLNSTEDNEEDDEEEIEEEDEDEEMLEAGERDSLLRSPSCHSECDHRAFPGCEHCSRDHLEYYQLYDQPSVGHGSDVEGDEGDDISLHVYQSLRDVADKTSINLDTFSTGSVSPTKQVYMNGSVIVTTGRRDAKSPVHHV